MNFNFHNPNNLTDAELVRLVQCQDDEAFTELISRYSPKIWSIVLDNSRETRDAEEILMDIWLAVWQNIIGLRNIGSFGAWLRKIAKNACNRYYASKTNQHAEIIMDYEDLTVQIDRESEQRFHDAKLRTAAREAVHQLPNKVRSIAEMYYLDLFSVNDLAEEFNLPVGTIKSKLSEVRQLLRKEFEIEQDKEDTMSTQHKDSKSGRTKCKIVGVGGAGCNAVKQLYKKEDTDIIDYGMEDGIELVYYAIDTDIDALNSCNEISQIQIGRNVTQGQGTGGKLELGRRAAAENMEELQSIVSDADMLFIIAGMGGGTGTAVAPVIASMARAQKTVTVCIATRPFDTEGKHREDIADQGVSELKNDPDSCADAIIVVPNEQMLESQKLNLQISELFQQNNEILVHGVSIILDILVESGEINVGFEDLQNMFSDQGTMLMGIGKAKGENRATIAARNALNSLFIQEYNIGSNPAMLINIYSPPNFTMHELDQTMRAIVEQCQEAEPIFGLVYKDELEKNDEVIVTIISGCTEKQESSPPSIPTKEEGKTPKQDAETPSSDPDSVTSQSRNFFNMLIDDQQVPESVQIAIDNSVSVVIMPD